MNIRLYKVSIALLSMCFTITSCNSNEEKQVSNVAEQIAYKPFIIKSLPETQSRFNSFMKKYDFDFRINEWLKPNQSSAFSFEFTENIECTFDINKMDSSVYNITLLGHGSKSADIKLQTMIIALIAITDTSLNRDARAEIMNKIAYQDTDKEVSFIHNNIYYSSYKPDGSTFLMKICHPSNVQ